MRSSQKPVQRGPLTVLLIVALAAGLLASASLVQTAAASAVPPTGFVAGQSVEIPSARTATTSTYLNPDGSRSLETGLLPLNYLDTSGNWQPINTSVVADPNVAGGFESAANAWTAHFAPLPAGLTVDTSNGPPLQMSPTGTATVAPQVAEDGHGVIYPNAWPGADLEYLVLPTSVKEEIVLHQRPASPSFAFTTGSLGYSSSGAGLVPQGGTYPGTSLQPPVVFGATGEPVFAAAPTLTSSASGNVNQVAVNVSSTWLNSLTSSSYPVIVDPSIQVGSYNMQGFASTGTSCTSCGVRVGNDQSGDYGANRYWRSVGYFDYASIDGQDVTNASIALGDEIGGEDYNFTITAYEASAYSYAGAIHDPLASSPSGASLTLSSAAMTSEYNTVVSKSENGLGIGFSGLEYAGQFSFQQFDTFELTLTYSPPPHAPAAPTAVKAAPGNAQATVTWTASATNGSPVTSYKVTGLPSGTATTANGTTTSAVVTGLANNTSYTFTVVAESAAGPSAASGASNAVIPTAPASAPSAPTSVVATAGNAQATVTWTASVTHGTPVTSYTARASLGGFTATTTNGTTLTATVTGLTNGTSYTFTVAANSTAGTSTASAPSNAVTPAVAPTHHCDTATYCWGVDSSELVTSAFLTQIKTAYGNPDFFGQYLTISPGNGSILASSAFPVLHTNGTGVQLIAGAITAEEVTLTGAAGTTDGATVADDAATAATNLNIPANNTLAIFADLESSFHPSSSWIQGFADEMVKDRFIPGFYESPDPSNYFAAPYCAVATDTAVGNAILWSQNVSQNDPTPETQAPAFGPEQLSCSPTIPTHTDAWQYRLANGATVNVDEDEIIPADVSLLYYP
jgi:hypothetical protein